MYENKAIGFGENVLATLALVGIGVLVAPIFVAVLAFCLPVLAIVALVALIATAVAFHKAAKVVDEAQKEWEQYVPDDCAETIDLNRNEWK